MKTVGELRKFLVDLALPGPDSRLQRIGVALRDWSRSRPKRGAESALYNRMRNILDDHPRLSTFFRVEVFHNGNWVKYGMDDYNAIQDLGRLGDCLRDCVNQYPDGTDIRVVIAPAIPAPLKSPKRTKRPLK